MLKVLTSVSNSGLKDIYVQDKKKEVIIRKFMSELESKGMLNSTGKVRRIDSEKE